MKSYEQYLRDSAVSRQIIDDFLDPAKPSWARFDPDTGYILGNSLQHDGLDDCWTLSTAQGNGARTARLYSDRPCRINTYGNSFTQCHQVSDGETWQEYLAAHLGEPIRNFGMGGFGVYQSYRRMIRTEAGDLGAKYVLLYIWGDDHQRSLMRCRHAITYPWWNVGEGKPFHGNFWAHIALDPATGTFVERENLLRTPESLYRMTDPDFMAEALKDDVMVQLYSMGWELADPATVDLSHANAIADALGVPRVDTRDKHTVGTTVHAIITAYGFAATKVIIEKAAAFCRARGKELMIILLCPTVTRQLLRGEPRYDQPIVDDLDQQRRLYFDMNRVHLADYRSFNLPVEDYMKRYFIGHYSPAGNHFFAYALKDPLVRWLDPKPITYNRADSRVIDFEGYLPQER